MIKSVASMFTRPGSLGGPRVQHFASGGGPMRPPRRAAWLSLALLSLFTMAAGAAVAHMLPPRLALWRLPTVASRGLAQVGPVLGAVPDPPTGGGAHPGETPQSGPVARPPAPPAPPASPAP